MCVSFAWLGWVSDCSGTPLSFLFCPGKSFDGLDMFVMDVLIVVSKEMARDDAKGKFTMRYFLVVQKDVFPSMFSLPGYLMKPP